MTRSPTHRRARRSLLISFGLALALALGLGGAAVPAVAAPAATQLTFTGRGWGHGRGMGQFGALGYAVDHGWTTEQILGHFYQPATLATNAGNPTVSVELTELTNIDTIVTAPGGVRVDGVARGNAVLLRREGAQIAVFSGSGCAGPWTRVGTTTGASSTISLATATTAANQLLRVCRPDTMPDPVYRGTLRVNVVGTNQFTINELDMQSYLQGVVPREMPASWASLGSGRGAAALRAQAVAARSFALASGRRASEAMTCDSTACQVYGGAGAFNGGAFTAREDARSNEAVRATNGWVMRMPSGAVARTEYSSSTGGFTAPGGPFTPVPDAGDSVAQNPNHTWTVTIPATEVAAALGTGPIATMAVTGRNGFGADGGRATEVTVTDVGGRTSTFTGARVRSALGTSRVRSDWFTVTGAAPAAPLPPADRPAPQPPQAPVSTATALITALYEDLLGRAPDPSGMATWSAHLNSGGSQANLVHAITGSQEYAQIRITEAYRTVLRRWPDSAGMTGWVRSVMSGAVSVDDVAWQFLRSAEFGMLDGGGDASFVDRLYGVALGRSAGESEVQFWTGQIRARGRDAVVRDIWRSEEAARLRVTQYFRTFLRRAPDSTGLVFWTGVLMRDGADAVRIGIAGSEEYRILAVRRAGG